MGIATIAVMRCVIVFAPQVVFDVDPAIDPTPLTGLGMAGGLLLDVLLLCVCACGLLGEWLDGRGLDGLLCLLAWIPLPIVLWHGWGDAGNLWQGATWAAAAIACATIAHLARDRLMRTIIIALLVATIIPLLARGASQLTYEHQDTVRLFEQTKDQFFRSRGWEADSANARIYERRLREPLPTGWFTSSNVYASLAAFGLVCCAGLAIAAIRARMQSGWLGAMALGALSCAAAVWLSGSKGAMGAAILGLALFMILSSKRARVPGALIIAMTAVTLLAVVARGLLMPEGFAGDKSLLFRWHYTVASAQMFGDDPLVGVGPDGYQSAYMLHRVSRNPEEVASAHSMFWDWLCALGISGTAWMALIVIVLWRAGRSGSNAQSASHSHILENARISETDATEQNKLAGSAGVAAAVVVVLSLLPAAIIEWPALDGIGLMVRALAMAGYVLAAFIIAVVVNSGDQRAVNAAIIAGVGALVVHGQIEMTFHQPGSVVWAMTVVGVLGGARMGVRRGRGASMMTTVAAAAIICAMAIWLVLAGVVPAARQQGAMLEAARQLEPLRANPKDIGVMLERRQSAADQLVRAYELWPANVHPLEAAATQLELAASQPNGPQPLKLLIRAQEMIDRAIAEHEKPSSVAIAIGIHTRLAMLTNDQEHWSAAIHHARQMTELDPNGLGAWRRLGDVLWLSGAKRDAADAYRRALECDANFALDPLKQLTQKDRETLQLRIDATE